MTWNSSFQNSISSCRIIKVHWNFAQHPYPTACKWTLYLEIIFASSTALPNSNRNNVDIPVDQDDVSFVIYQRKINKHRIPNSQNRRENSYGIFSEAKDYRLGTDFRYHFSCVPFDTDAFRKVLLSLFNYGLNSIIEFVLLHWVTVIIG